MAERLAVQVADDFHFPEVPRWRDGELYFSDFYARTVFVLRPEGHVEAVCEVANVPAGLGFAPDGALLIVSMTDRKLLRLEGQQLTLVADMSALAAFPCNDMLVDEQGRAYVGNFGWDPDADPKLHLTNLLMVATDGHVRVVARDLNFPNGMVKTPDGRTLIVAETFASRLSAFDVQPDGALTNRRLWASLSGRTFATTTQAVASGAPLPDGLALDAEGAIWMGDAAGSAALRITAGGRILDRVETGALAVYAVALGGRDRRTLYMCAAPSLGKGNPRVERKGALLSCRVDVPGAGLP